MIRYARLATPLGTLIATAAGGALTGLYFEGRPHAPRVGADWVEDAAAAPLRACAKQLGEYFDGVRKTFDLPLTPDGSAFQRRYHEILQKSPDALVAHGAVMRLIS